MKKKFLVMMTLLLSLATVILAACGGTAAAELSVKDNYFTLTDGVYTAEVGSDVTEVDILSKVTVNEGYALKLYSDKELTAEVEGAAKISVGVNTFYIKAEPTGKGEAKSFTVRITRAAEYKITFTVGGEVHKEVTVTAGGKVNEADVTAPTKPGYTFAGWEGFDFSVAPTANMTVEATWTANTDTPYKVEHYKQNANKDGYTLAETENKTGTTDTVATASSKTDGEFAGFVPNQGMSVMSGVIAGNGSLVLKVYYDLVQVAYKVEVYLENTADNNYALDSDLTETLYGDDGESVTYTPDQMTGFTVDSEKSDLTIDNLDSENPAGNVVKVYYKRVRAQVTFKQDASDAGTSLTAKYGVGLVNDDGAAVSAPEFTGTPSDASKEFYWALDGGQEADFTALTAAVTVTKAERVAEYEITFDLNFDADYDTDGYTPYLPADAPEKYAKGDEVVFFVAVSGDFNKSDVQYVFKASNASAGAGQVIDVAYDETESAYKYTFTATAPGVVSLEGEYEENVYEVSGQLNMADWAVIDSFDEVTVELHSGTDITDVVVKADGSFAVDVKKGVYSFVIRETSGREVAVNELSIQPADWEDALTYAYDFGDIAVGLPVVSGLTVNFDGTIDTISDAQTNVNFVGFEADEYAVKVRASFIGGTEGDPGLGFRIAKGESTLELVLMSRVIRINGSGFDWSSDRIDISHGLSNIWEKEGHEFEYTLVRSANGFLLLSQVIGIDSEPVVVARVSAEKAEIVASGASYGLSSKATALINTVLSGANTVQFYSSVNIAGGATLDATYTNYGYKTEGISGTVTVPDALTGGVMTAQVAGNPVENGKVVIGSEVAVSVTPDNGKKISAFNVKVNDGSFEPVTAASFGTVTGNVNDGYTFTFTLLNAGDSYEFAAEFADAAVKYDVTGTVTDLDGSAPIEGVKVIAYVVNDGVRGEAFSETVTDVDGAYTLGLSAGEYELEFTADNYYTRVVSGVTVADQAVNISEATGLKAYSIGGQVTIGSRVVESSVGRLFNAYDYATGKETVSSGRGVDIGDGHFIFSGVTGENAVIKYTITLDGMQGSSIQGEYWPGVGINIYNGSGDKTFKLIRDGVTGEGVSGNLYGLSPIDITGQNGTMTVDVMFVKYGANVYAFSKLPDAADYNLVYKFTISDSSYLNTELGYGLRLSVNPAQICWVDYSDLSISTDSDEINALFKNVISVKAAEHGESSIKVGDADYVSGETDTAGSDVTVSFMPETGYRVDSVNMIVNGDADGKSNITGNLDAGTGQVRSYTFKPALGKSYEFEVSYIEISKVASVTGKTVQKDAPEKAASGITVKAYNSSDALAATAVSGDDGAFALDLESGEYTLHFEAPNYYAYEATVSVEVTADGETIALQNDFALKYKTVGGQVTIGDKTVVSNATAGIKGTYDYGTDTETIQTYRTPGVGDRDFVFSDVTAAEAVIKYTVSIDDMAEAEASLNKESWPGIGIRIYNASGYKYFNMLRRGVKGSDRSDLGTGAGSDKWNKPALGTVDLTFKTGETVVADLMFVKTGKYVYAFSKLPSEDKYELRYGFLNGDTAFQGEVAYGLSVGCGGSLISWLDYTNISIAAGTEAVTSALAGYDLSFDLTVLNGTEYNSGVADRGDGNFRTTEPDARMNFRSTEKYGDFIASVNVTTRKYPCGSVYEGNGDWSNMGIAIGADKNNVMLISAADTGMRVWHTWDNELQKTGDSTALANDSYITGAYLAGGGESFWGENVSTNVKIIRKGTTVYVIRDGIYLFKLALENDALKVIYSDGTEATGYSFMSKDNKNDVLAVWKTIMNSDSLMVGVGLFGNDSLMGGFDSYSVTETGVDEAIAAAEAGMKNEITVDSAENGTSAITVGGGAYEAGAVTAGKEVTVTFTPSYAEDGDKYMVESLYLIVDGDEAGRSDVTGQLTVGANQVASYSFKPAQGKSYRFQAVYVKMGAEGTLTGSVTSLADSPAALAGVTVGAYNAADVLVSSAVTGEDGSFAIEGIISGEYTLKASKENYFSRSVAYTATVESDGASISVPDAIQLKFMPTGGTVTINEVKLTSDLTGINTTYDYDTDTLWTGTPRNEKGKDQRNHMFTDFVSSDVAVDFTVKFDAMTGVSEVEWWPGIAVMAFDGETNSQFRFLRFGVVDGGSNISTGPSDLKGDSWGLGQTNLTGEYGANSVDLRVVKKGSRVYMYSKYSSVEKYSLVYTYKLDETFAAKDLAWGLTYAVNNTKYCYIDWENISITGDSAAIEAKITEAGGESLFNYSHSINDSAIDSNKPISRMNDDWYSFSANGTFTYSNIAAKEFIAEVKVMGGHDLNLDMPGDALADSWNTAGFAIGATDYNRVIIGAQGSGFKLYRNTYTNDRWSAGKDLSTHDMFNQYGNVNGVEAVNNKVETTLKIVKTAEAVYVVRDNLLFGKLAADGKVYDALGNLTSYVLPDVWPAIMSADTVAIGVGCVGNQVVSFGVKDFTVNTDAEAVAAAVAELDGYAPATNTETAKFNAFDKIYHYDNYNSISYFGPAGEDKIKTYGALLKEGTVGVDDNFLIRTTVYSVGSVGTKAGINLEYNDHSVLFGYEKEGNRIYVVQGNDWYNYNTNKFAVTGLPEEWSQPDGTADNALEIVLVKVDGEYYIYLRRASGTEWTVAKMIDLSAYGIEINDGSGVVPFDFKYKVGTDGGYLSTATSLKIGIAAHGTASTFGGTQLITDATEIQNFLTENPVV